MLDWFWSWNSNTLATWCEELTHLKRPWCWERLRAGGEGDDSEWDGWMASPTQWTWLWVNSRELVMDSEAWCAAVHGVTKSWIRLNDWTELDCSPPGSSVHGILQARILEWFAMPSFTGSSRPRNQSWISCIAGRYRQILYHQNHLGSPTRVLCCINLSLRWIY